MYCVKVFIDDAEMFAASLDGEEVTFESHSAVKFASREEAEAWANWICRHFKGWVVLPSEEPKLRRSDRPKKEDPLQEAIEFLYGTGDSLKRSLVGELHNLSIYTKNKERQVKALEIARKLEAWK